MRQLPIDACLKLIQRFEGSAGQHEPIPRKDPVGNWEIGWSHRIPGPAYAFQPLTRLQADMLAVADLSCAAANAYLVCDSAIDALSANQYAALCCFIYNVGLENFRQSTLAKLIRQGKLDTALGEFGKWVYGHDENGAAIKLPGLATRRAAEANLWKTP